MLHPKQNKVHVFVHFLVVSEQDTRIHFFYFLLTSFTSCSSFTSFKYHFERNFVYIFDGGTIYFQFSLSKFSSLWLRNSENPITFIHKSMLTFNFCEFTIHVFLYKKLGSGHRTKSFLISHEIFSNLVL